MFKSFYSKHQILLILILLPVVVLAATYGPISTKLFGGVNRDLDYASDASALFPAATAAAQAVLGPQMNSFPPKVLKGDKIKFTYPDGSVHTLEYGGCPKCTLIPFREVSGIRFDCYTGASARTRYSGNYVVDGYWEPRSYVVTDNGTDYPGTDGWYVATTYTG